MKTVLKRVFASVLAIMMVLSLMPATEAKAEETKEILLQYYWLDPEDGYSINSERVNVPINATYGDVMATLPIPESTENYSFLGWECAYGELGDVVNDGARVVFNATYDKYPVTILRTYLDVNDQVKTETFTEYYPAGTSFEVIHNKYAVSLPDMSTNYTFTKWNASVQTVEKVGLNKTSCRIFADYDGYNIIEVNYDYIEDCGEYGVEKDGRIHLFVEKYLATSKYEDELIAYFTENFAPDNHYSALGFTEWIWWNGDNWDAEEENDDEMAVYVPIYSKTQYVIDDGVEAKVYAVEPGQVMELPAEIDGKKVTWKCDYDNTVYENEYTIPADATNEDMITMTAVYAPVEVNIYKEQYIEASDKWEITLEKMTVPGTATPDDIMKLLSNGSDLSSCKFTGWEFLGYAETTSHLLFRAVYDKNIVTVCETVLDEDGLITWNDKILFLDKTATYQDVINTLTTPETVMGCSFVKWQIDSEDVPLDAVINTNYIDLYAAYDNYPVYIGKTYANKEGIVTYDESIKVYPAGTKMTDIFNENKLVPADSLADTFEWSAQIYEEEISILNNWIELTAKYEDKVIVRYSYNYITQKDTHGQTMYSYIYELLDKELCLAQENIIKYAKDSLLPKLNLKHYDKLQLLDWTMYDAEDMDGDGYYDYMHFESNYNVNDVIIVSSWIYNQDLDYVWVVNPGDKVTLLSNVDGYYVEWEDIDNKLVADDIYTVPSDAKAGEWYELIGKKVSKIPVQNDASAVVGDTNNVLPIGTTIVSEKLISGTKFENGKMLLENTITNIKNFAAFEINLLDKNGVELSQLSGKIYLTVPIPFQISAGNSLKVFRIDESVAGGALVECPITLSGDKVTIETDHFSTYVFVEYQEATVPDTTPDTNPVTSPKTGDTSFAGYVMLFVFASAILVVIKKRNFIK